MTDARKFHREARFRAIDNWSRNGVLNERKRLPIEEDFIKRVERQQNGFFLPLALQYSDDPSFNQQVACLVEAYDALPTRVDIAFDSTWKALESSISDDLPGESEIPKKARNLTAKLAHLAEKWRGGRLILEDLLKAIPVQSCEYLGSRLLEGVGQYDNFSPKLTRSRLVRNCQSSDQLRDLMIAIDTKYGTDASPASKRRAAMFLRLALHGKKLIVPAGEIQLELPARNQLLLNGLIYTARNDRFHGDSFSPFISSAATIRTYTHPIFLFICTYAVLHMIWASPDKERGGLNPCLVRDNVKQNIELAVLLFGRHWN